MSSKGRPDARRRRLSRSGDFDRVYREGNSCANRFLVLYSFPRSEEERNATAEWLKQSYPQFANLPPAQGFEAAMKMMAQAQGGGNADPASWRA